VFTLARWALHTRLLGFDWGQFQLARLSAWAKSVRQIADYLAKCDHSAGERLNDRLVPRTSRGLK
jgi:hypothetical protein